MFREDKAKGESTEHLDEIGLILDKAADYMEEHGMCATATKGPNGEVCFWRAIMEVCKSVSSDPPVGIFAWLQNYLGEDIVKWISRPETTKEMAVAALRSAARLRT